MMIRRAMETTAALLFCILLLSGCLGTAREDTGEFAPTFQKENIVQNSMKQMTLVDYTASPQPLQKTIRDSRHIDRVLSLWENTELRQTAGSSDTPQTLFTVSCPEASLSFSVGSDGVRFQSACYETPSGFLEQLRIIFKEARERAVPYAGM